MCSLHSLPREIIAMIARLCETKDIVSWAQTSRKFSIPVLNEAYRLNVQHGGSSALFWAAQQDRPALAKNMLRYVSDTNVVYGEYTPLIESAKSGSKEVFDLIMKRPELDVNVELRGISALWMAASKGHGDIVSGLLQHPGVIIDNPGRLGLTPFGASVLYGSFEVTNTLWATGQVDLNHMNEDGETPLILALRRSDKALAHFLLERDGFSLDCADDYGQSAMVNAIRHGLPSIVDKLLMLAPWLANSLDGQGRTPLLTAVQYGMRDTVRHLLEASARTDISDDQGQTCLLLALPHGRPMVELLLGYGANVEETDSSGYRLLHRAVKEHHADVIPTLLEHEADINAKDPEDYTALGLAIDGGYYPAIRYLLADRNVDVNMPSAGYPPLTLAIMSGHVPIVRLLCEMKKLDPNRLDHDSQTPLSAAIVSQDGDMIDILLQRQDVQLNEPGPYINSPLFSAVSSRNRYAIHRLIQCNGINLNDGSLLRAVADDAVGITSDLLSAGCNVNLKGEGGLSALMIAAMNGNLSIMRRLFRRSELNVNAKDEKGRTALFWALDKKQPQAFKRLLEDARVPKDRDFYGTEFDKKLRQSDEMTALVRGTKLLRHREPLRARRARPPLSRYTTL